MKQYFDYIKKVFSWLNDLSRKEGICRCWLYWDYCFAALRHGCLIRQYVIGEFWKLSYQERKRRLTYPRIVKLFKRYNQHDYIHYLDVKAHFNDYFSTFVKRGWIHSTEVSEEQFVAFIIKHDAVIIKPIDGTEGNGIRKFVLSANPKTDLSQLYSKLKEEDVIIEEIIVQHPRMVFGNSSVNTIRIYAILDSHGRGHVVKTILRAGVGKSVVDNYCKGGVIYEVDVKTGIVCSHGQSKANRQNYVHPGTDIVMLGYRIPHWDKVIEMSISASEQLPQVRIIGWDIAITASGVEMIEGNPRPDYELLEFLGSTGYFDKFKKYLSL